MFKKLCIILTALFLSTFIHADFDYTTYKKAGFTEIKAEHGKSFFANKDNSHYTISATTFKYRIPVMFSRKIRNITSNNRTVLNEWGTSLRVKKQFLDLYQKEFMVRFNDETYWIPVQEPLVEAMGNELHQDDEFELYVLLIGSIQNNFVFLTTEFKSNRIVEE